jgi:hypothetical protein
VDAESPPALAPAPAKPAAPVQANFFQEISMTKMGENMGKTHQPSHCNINICWKKNAHIRFIIIIRIGIRIRIDVWL